MGCADQSREGYIDVVTYPSIAACNGAWQTPGLIADNTRVPTCNRQSGNTGNIRDGNGCTVADVCASGWHVCESAAEVNALAVDCTAALAPFGNTSVFFVTRQRAFSVNGGAPMCSVTNTVGSNNLHGCGTFGITEDQSCAPFPLQAQEQQCLANSPWSCGEQTNDATEADDVMKNSSVGGGALCCRDGAFP